MGELLLLTLHTIGLAVGVGGATATDPLFINSIRNRHISSDQLVLIQTLSKVVLTGLALLVISGIGLLWLQPHLIVQSGFLAKMTLVFVIAVDGTIFHFRVIPVIEDHVDEDMDAELLCEHLPLLSATGATSSISWYSTLMLAMLLPFDLPYLLVINIYLLVVVAGVIGAYLVLSHLIFSPQPDPEEMVEDSKFGGAFGWLPLVIAIVILGIIALGVGQLLSGDEVGDPAPLQEATIQRE